MLHFGSAQPSWLTASTSLFHAFPWPLSRLGMLCFSFSIHSYSLHSQTLPFPFHSIMPPISMTPVWLHFVPPECFNIFVLLYFTLILFLAKTQPKLYKNYPVVLLSNYPVLLIFPSCVPSRPPSRTSFLSFTLFIALILYLVDFVPLPTELAILALPRPANHSGISPHFYWHYNGCVLQQCQQKVTMRRINI